MKIKNFIAYNIFISIVFSWHSAIAEESNNVIDGYSFDDAFLLGNAKKVDFNSLSKDGIAPGNWMVDIYVNNTYLYRKDLLFVGDSKTGKVTPCLVDSDVASLGIKSDVLSKITSNDECHDLTQLSPDIQVKLSPSILRLNISIPQELMTSQARGYVPIYLLDEGVPAATLSYNLSGYHSEYNHVETNDGYGNINSGLNFGLFRLRQQSVLQYNDSNKFNYSSVRTYIQRAIPSLNSEATVGDSFTNGDIFESFAFRGVRVTTDERMRPDSQRGFAPTVYGIADTHARVRVRQNGYVIYETSVSPGPFSIDDLYPTGYGGALSVEIQEADGKIKTYEVPFSTVPGLLRTGQFNYDLNAGRLRNDNAIKDIFYQGTVRYGLSNFLTAYGGAQYSNNYLAATIGAAVNTPLGAFSADMTSSRAQVNDNQNVYSGAMTRVTWNKLFDDTGTNVALAGYRYESANYLSLTEALSHSGFSKSTRSLNNRKEQFSLTLNQDLAGYGSFFVNGSIQTWRDNSQATRQGQIGYNNTFKGISYSLSYVQSYDSNNRSDNQVLLSLSVPFSNWDGNSLTSLTSYVSHSRAQGWQEQIAMNGVAGNDKSISWGAQANKSTQSDASFSANMEKRFSGLAINTGYSQAKSNRTISAGANGALVAYQGGIIPSRYLGDTVGIIEADGANNAALTSWSDIKVNKSGQAVVPSLTPYRYNDISLDAEQVSSDVDLKNSNVRIAPYAGAVVRVHFDTLQGYGLLINTRSKSGDGVIAPFGASVYDQNNSYIGLVGQGSVVYARVSTTQGLLTVKWGEKVNERCQIKYNLEEKKDKGNNMTRINSSCNPY
ncbi:fimbria/pilus outer membrane usher protein [Citrobacter koseri]|uniref:fimbria/pilus outer membrane usher protein n=1 Tax=Citrobacter koseri TaxID=545 RepID=UPI00080A9396|nr:fimbria/pilus outer membrane usher protein [Citrobacter koseri]